MNAVRQVSAQQQEIRDNVPDNIETTPISGFGTTNDHRRLHARMITDEIEDGLYEMNQAFDAPGIDDLVTEKKECR